MPKKQSETTEAKFFTNAEFLVAQIATLGGDYKPPNPHAALAVLQANLAAALPLRTAFQQKSSIEEETRNSRETLHQPTSKLMTDLIKYCDSAGWDKNDLDNLRSFSREYKGRRAVPKQPADPNNPNGGGQTISSAQTSYAGKTEHFANFVETLRANAVNFNPSETKFLLTTLDATLAAKRQANTDVTNATAETDTARTALDAPLYTTADNLCDGLNSAIKYLGSAFRDHQVYHNVKKLKFKKPKRLL